MAIRTTTWRPDTCSCVLSYDWDDELPLHERVHNIKEIDCSLCPSHMSLPTMDEQYAAVKESNGIKNSVHEILMESFPQLTETFKREAEDVTRLKDGVFSHRLDDQRKLLCTINGISDPEKQTLNQDLKLMFGDEKIEVV